ncbi:MAG: hypothetical protein JWP17_2976 [Solirubrobacterales bacterium]|jgi:hypothetical protein|nr:hypothetical protein [Solirubrobacterales bacterium]
MSIAGIGRRPDPRLRVTVLAAAAVAATSLLGG